MKYHTLFFSNYEKMSQNASSAAVVIGALRVKKQILVKVISLKFEPSEPTSSWEQAREGIYTGSSKSYLIFI